MKKEIILVLDFGSQYNQLIVRAVRNLNVYSELVGGSITAGQIKKIKPKGLILSGGPRSVYDRKSPLLDKEIYNLNIPILGICYGMQAVTHQLGGGVKNSGKREYGSNTFKITKKSRLFSGLKKNNRCWMSHQDEVKIIPPGFQTLAESSYKKTAAIGNDKRKIYGVQFHPEVSHTPSGDKIIKNFLKICSCRFNWSEESFIKETIKEIKDKVKTHDVFCALSGGVDSTVAATLVSYAIGRKLHCLMVDNGLLRHEEGIEVKKLLEKHTKLDIRLVNAQDHFLKKLKGVINPEAKRKIIGNEFIKIFEKEIKNKAVKFMVQGTLYPDIIESGGAGLSKSAVIKTHHNVGGLPLDLKFKLIEPLKYLFKDEVRKVGKELGIPDNILKRQPFPGPGLAVRIIGEVTEERLDVLRKADKIVTDVLEPCSQKGGNKISGKLWQYFAVLLPLKTVGVMGDQRTYHDIIAIRAVISRDAMTAEAANINWKILKEISTKIVNEVKGINRVVYDITSKPPGTIEWE